MPEIMSLVANPVDNFRDTFTKAQTLEDIRRSSYFMLRSFVRMERKWWQHPKWHIHHWRVQVRFLLWFKRWAFTRCAKCGGRFKWMESGVSHQWDSGGPMWFRSEDLTHSNCDGSSESNKPAQMAGLESV
jgi:hypothetical protein